MCLLAMTDNPQAFVQNMVFWKICFCHHSPICSPYPAERCLLIHSVILTHWILKYSVKYISIRKICIIQWTNTFQMTNVWNYKTTQASKSTQNTNDLIGWMVALNNGGMVHSLFPVSGVCRPLYSQGLSSVFLCFSFSIPCKDICH